ncbi:MAG: tRNA 2-thiouridine(34) synthase MnmA, partial [Clostridia bacterium]|nr:tRNA 2-thiouridine(34) synthase MnmA [Clostridia bacterium]
EGNFVDEDGNVLGRHKGIIHYTVGQRKGLGIALGRPAYVKKINAESNEIVLSTEDAGCTQIVCKNLNFMSIEGVQPGEKIGCLVKVRYRHPGQRALLEQDGEDRVRITFDMPVRSAAPGQSAVFYDEDGRIIGGGVIAKIV